MSGFDTHSRMRMGDASAWPRWRPEFLCAGDVADAWAHAMRTRGSPGSPRAVRVYTHFAYCESTCDFCMYFHKVPTESSAYARYADHLIGLVREFGARCGRTRASAAYFGGGTPSAMPLPELGRYFEAFSEVFEIDGEFSIEAHPRSASVELIALLSSFGVNRVSMGLQSLEPAVLRTITRRNRPIEDVAEFVAAARAAGIVVNTDLCLALPNQSLPSFQRDVRTLLDVGPDIITLYLYQPVSRLPTPPPAEMTYERALDPSIHAELAERGYRADTVAAASGTVRLVRHDMPNHGWQRDRTYALFDREPSHLLGFGPAAYGHIFGYGWFRDATSMDTIGTGPPVYWGTRLSHEDEYRQILLDALHSRHTVDLHALDTIVGIDGRATFGAALSDGVRSGVLSDEGTVLRFLNGADDSARERVIDALIPPEPEVTVAPTGAPSHEPALVVLRSKRGRAVGAAPDLVRSWCEAIGVPMRGHRFYGAVVRDFDDSSVHFAVGSAKATPLRVLVRRPGGSEKNLFETTRFGISYAARPELPLSEDERSFFTFLARRTRMADPR